MYHNLDHKPRSIPHSLTANKCFTEDPLDPRSQGVYLEEPDAGHCRYEEGEAAKQPGEGWQRSGCLLRPLAMGVWRGQALPHRHVRHHEGIRQKLHQRKTHSLLSAEGPKRKVCKDHGLKSKIRQSAIHQKACCIKISNLRN